MTDKNSGKKINEAKVLLVGQGGVGKTSIVNRLKSSKFDAAEPITKGINIEELKVNIDKEEYKLKVWDFGGQAIMHSTHQFFLTQRSVYILVIDARLGERENFLEYWLKLIESFGGDSPILLVINKIDQHILVINKKGIKNKYRNIVSIIETSCKTGEGIEKLKSDINKAVVSLPHIHNYLPESWLRVREKIESYNKSYLSYNKYQQICQSEGVEDQNILIEYFHDMGVIFHYKDDPRLEDTFILNPNWITAGVYKIVNSSELSINNGILTLDLLQSILDSPDYPKDKQLFIIELMRKFELCFELEDSKGNKFLIPELLTKQEPEFDEVDGSICLEYHYNILPQSIISRFIVRMHPFIFQNTYWRNGVILKFKENIAVVKSDTEDNKLVLKVSGNEDTRREFFSQLMFQMESIHKTIPSLKVNVKIPIPNHPETLVDFDHLMRLADMGETTYIPEGHKERIDIWEVLGGFRQDFLKKVKGTTRFRYMDKFTIIATILGILISILLSIYEIIPKLSLFLKSLFSYVDNPFASFAVASTNSTGNIPIVAPLEIKTVINIGIMICIIIAFIWTLAVSLQGETSARVKRASDLNKMLLGFLLGSARSFMGL